VLDEYARFDGLDSGCQRQALVARLRSCSVLPEAAAHMRLPVADRLDNNVLPEDMYKRLQSAKISIHGPELNHLGKQHFRYDLAKPKELEAAVKAGARSAITRRRPQLSWRVLRPARIGKRRVRVGRCLWLIACIRIHYWWWSGLWLS
jgi:hypothetical protein